MNSSGGDPPPPRDKIAELRASSVGRLLLRASRAYNERAMRLVRERGHEQLTIAHASVLPHIDMAGSRLSDISERAGMTKQSASELVRGLEGLGYLTRRQDPSDGRAQLIVFTEAGERFLEAAYAAKLTLESELTERLGAEGAAELRSLLGRYVDGER